MDANVPHELTVPLHVRLPLQIAGLRLENHELQQRLADLEAQVARLEAGHAG